MEDRMMRHSMKEIEKRILALDSQIAEVEESESMKDLKRQQKATMKKTDQEQENKRFREFKWKGYKIWVGKNSRNNDILTIKYAHKEDLWLHARGVPGSHVVLKQQGKDFPQDIIETAAEIAAYYSKGSGSVLCPVIYTRRKYVRKPKGSEPGTVAIEREEVIMVEPTLSKFRPVI